MMIQMASGVLAFLEMYFRVTGLLKAISGRATQVLEVEKLVERRRRRMLLTAWFRLCHVLLEKQMLKEEISSNPIVRSLLRRGYRVEWKRGRHRLRATFKGSCPAS